MTLRICSLCINGKVDNYKETGLLGSLTIFIRSIIIWERVHDFQLGMESHQQNVNLTAPTITFPGIEEYELFTITFKPVIGMIYENSKKENRVMIHKEIHKFCDATLKRVLERLKKYNKDMKYGYVDPSPSDADAEYLRYYEEDIEDHLKHRLIFNLQLQVIMKWNVIEGIRRNGIVEDVLVELAGVVYPIDFVILDIKEDKFMPLILGTPFLTTARAPIRCSNRSMTLRAGKFKVRFIKTLRFPKKVKKKEKNNLDLMIPTNHVNRRILE
ncbi:mitotic checkpoint serine/threonine-protein kinase BUB1 [Tanacetum coccineum]|uniref:Mitotic checkpoint serine/threonine-protein kinase BUB1 n=1 Tax=Tanacetum coccineum TaxID=301880 RepID=A0ABQ5CZ33_9ASTR